MPEFFRSFFRYCSSSVAQLRISLTLKQLHIPPTVWSALSFVIKHSADRKKRKIIEQNEAWIQRQYWTEQNGTFKPLFINPHRKNKSSSLSHPWLVKGKGGGIFRLFCLFRLFCARLNVGGTESTWSARFNGTLGFIFPFFTIKCENFMLIL